MHFNFRNIAGFWKRQTQLPSTPRQRIFDAVFGILVPVVCVVVDPGVIRMGLIEAIALFAYLEIVIGIIALGYYLLFCRSSAFLTGVLFAGAFFSVLLAVVFLPFTLLFLIGAVSLFFSQPFQGDLELAAVFFAFVSLVPFVCAFVFARNAERCRKVCRTSSPRTGPQAVAVLAAMLTIGARVVLQLAVILLTHHSIQVVRSGSDQDVLAAVRTLKWLYVLPSVNVEGLVSSYKSSTDPHLRERLASAYWSITGRSVEQQGRDFHPW